MTYARNNLRLVIAVMMAVAAKATFGQSTNDIPPLLPALPELPPTFWEQYGIWITLGIILVIAAKGALIWWLLQPKPVVPVPIEIATRNALALLKDVPGDDRAVSQASQILKRYVAGAFDLVADEMTTAEFGRTLASSEKVGGEFAGLVSGFLQQCDERKFAPDAGGEFLAVARARELFELGERRRAELRKAVQPA